jgi:hypothetical protein
MPPSLRFDSEAMGVGSLELERLLVISWLVPV